jgi:hypothetical protein
MELDDFKNSWDSELAKEGQQLLTFQMIEQMTQKKYYTKVKKIALPEIIGMVICLLAAAFIGFNFYKLDTDFLKITAIISMLILVILSIISIVSLQPFAKFKDVDAPYVETLKRFAIHRLRFHKLQKVNVLLSYLLMVGIIILLSKLFKDIDLTGYKYFWIFSFTFGYIFLMFYAKWVMRYYRKTLSQTEELLEEVSDLSRKDQTGAIGDL